MKRKTFVYIFIMFVFTIKVHSEIYKWVDNKGIEHFSDRPNPADKQKMSKDQPVKQTSYQPLVNIEQLKTSLKGRVLKTEITDDFFDEFLSDVTIARDLAFDCLQQAKSTGIYGESCNYAAAYYAVTAYPKIAIIEKNKEIITPHQLSIIDKTEKLRNQSLEYLNEVQKLLEH